MEVIVIISIFAVLAVSALCLIYCVRERKSVKYFIRLMAECVLSTLASLIVCVAIGVIYYTIKTRIF
ncbi:MAG: hypothetical protein HFJ45_07465 [Clostridia bacterium]|nr:hypothetical protein [Clostridia bacterium]